MKRLAVGILAHVDAGKTTLSEGLLYQSGVLRKLGRVDHRDAFLDTYDLERERGITIFSKQARLPLPGGGELQLLDTPGHVDFSSEMERTLPVLDYAILVISGVDGIQGHTVTLWRLLARYQVPAFLFVNKMDVAGTDKAEILAALRRQLDGGCVDFGGPPDLVREEAALCDEDLLNRYLEEGKLQDRDLADGIRRRKIFPCYFGAALKLEGVGELLAGLDRFTRQPDYPDRFGANVYQISRDPKGTRLTFLKVTGGVLRVKDGLTNARPGLDGERVWQEKVDQIRLYGGEKFSLVEEVPAGTVCAVTGLSRTYPGLGLGGEAASRPPSLEPALTYEVILPEGADPVTSLQQLKLLEEEDPQLHLTWNDKLGAIHIQLMGQIQGEVLERRIAERFGLEVTFGQGHILYKETLAAPVEGVGHFEPLRHYAEVRLLLEPGARGSGLTVRSICPEDKLDRSWQRLILSHLGEKEHLGVLTGSPLTDVSITLTAGRAHVKHTEGGDFRQATYRAVRQGLMEGESLLLEPWYDFRLEIPANQLGRALSDLTQMAGRSDPPEHLGETVILTGAAPVACLQDYAAQVSSYTRGRGRLICTPRGYEPCHNGEEVIAALGYDPEGDLDNSPDSVFCTHGAGHVVKWNQVKAMAHVESGIGRAREEPETAAPRRERPASYAGALERDKELQAIFERTYGPVKTRQFQSPPPAPPPADRLEKAAVKWKAQEPEYLLVDGYNIIFAWDELKEVAREHLDAARKLLMDMLSNYQGFRKCQVILVFDAYKVKGGQGEVSRYHNITVVYTKEAETADAYIEKTTYEMAKRYRVRVATSDSPEQLIILGHGALRVSARAFHQEVLQAREQMDAVLAENNRKRGPRPVESALRDAQTRRRGKSEP